PFEGTPKGPPVVAWVGRGSDLGQKQIDKLAAIAPYLRCGGVRLWIADPDGPEKVIASAAQVLTPLAEFWGKVPHEKMSAFFRTVASTGGCVLSTSRFEGLPMAYL